MEGILSLAVIDKSEAPFPTQKVDSTIVFEEIDGGETPRPSLENHANARDLMCHLHGMSPACSNKLPHRLSISSISSVAGNGSNATNASPFPHAPSSTLKGHKKSLSFDFVET